MLFNTSAHVFKVCSDLLANFVLPTRSAKTRHDHSPFTDKETVEGRGGFAQDECGLAGPKEPQIFVRSFQEDWGAGFPPGPSEVEVGEGQQKHPRTRAL